MPVPRPISPWWGLALVPAALGVGWLAGNMPGPERPVPALSAAPATTPGASPSPFEPRPGDLHASATPGAAIVYSEWTTYDAALQQSRDNGKPVLLDFTAVWCGPCQALRHEVFENVAAAATVKAAVIPVSLVDRVRENGANTAALDKLQQRFDVQAFPTLVLLTPATGHFSKRVGYPGSEETLRWITETAAGL